MITRIGTGLMVAALGFLLPIQTSFASSTSDANKIKKYTKQLKNLPNGAAPAGKVSNLVKKLSKLRPGKTDQYYKIGLRKLGLPGNAALAFSKKLNADLQKIVGRSDLSSSAIASMTRRLNKTERLYVPANSDPTPTPVSPSAMVFRESIVI